MGREGQMDRRRGILIDCQWRILGESEYVEHVRQLRGLELVKERLSSLMKSNNQWIKEAAELAANSKA